MGASWSGCGQPRSVVNRVVSTGRGCYGAPGSRAECAHAVPPLYAVSEMRLLRSTVKFLDRYVTLAGKNCCAGRSWTMLDRSLTRRTKDST